jgi:hypothetical protein
MAGSASGIGGLCDSRTLQAHRLYPVTLTVQGFAANFSTGSSENEERRNIVPEHGFYHRRAYVSTRTALWFLLIGSSEIYEPLATGGW